MKINKLHMILPVLSASLLIACGGSSTSKKVSGYVLDGNVDRSRVCFDVNRDGLCTSKDNTVMTDSAGYFEIEYQEETITESYELIADVRLDEAIDNDYTDGRIFYDYSMKAFDVQNKKENIVISPMSSYLNYETNRNGKTKSEAVSGAYRTILTSDSFYTEENSIEIEYAEIIQGNFIKGKNSETPAVANFNKRLHNVNETLARQMQKSQQVWESRAVEARPSFTSTDWAEYGNVIQQNSSTSVFQSYEEIIEVVTSYDYEEFDAQKAADRFWPDVPSATDLDELLNITEKFRDNYSQFLELEDQAAGEFSGTPYKFELECGYGTTCYGYYLFSSSSITYYAEITYSGGDTTCAQASTPFPSNSGVSESQFIDNINKALAMNPGLSTQLVKVSSVPSGCSTIASLLDDMKKQIELDKQEALSSGDNVTIDTPSGYIAQNITPIQAMETPTPTVTSSPSSPPPTWDIKEPCGQCSSNACETPKIRKEISLK